MTVRIANPLSPDRSVSLELMVDTGATLSSFPRSVLASIGVRPGMARTFRLADERRVEREAGAVLATLDGVTINIPAMFADENDTPVLGATALETLGFAVDPVERKLIARDLRYDSAGETAGGGCRVSRNVQRQTFTSLDSRRI